MDHTSKCLLCSVYNNTRENEQTCKKLFCIVFIINCILIVALVVTVYYWKSQVRSITSSGHVKESARFCLKCENISVHPLDDENLLKEFERKENDTKCCTKDTSHVKYLVHQFLERNHRMYVSKEGIILSECPENKTGDKPAGRVVGVDHDRTDIDYDERHVLRWLNTEHYSYQNHGVMFLDGQLEITVSGYYWFNSRVTFRDTNDTISNDRFAFFHTIFRRSAEYPLRKDWKLVEAAKTRCNLRSGITDQSSFVGDIAYFKKGERVIVKVSHPELVSLTPYDSFLEVRLY